MVRGFLDCSSQSSNTGVWVPLDTEQYPKSTIDVPGFPWWAVAGVLSLGVVMLVGRSKQKTTKLETKQNTENKLDIEWRPTDKAIPTILADKETYK